MSVGTKLLQAAAGNAGETVYVDDVFSTFLYNGTGSAQTINNGIDISGEGGLVWIKGRGPNAFNHILEDTARGTNRYLRSNTNNAQLVGGNGVTAFNSNGFTTGTNGAVTYSGDEFVSWTFRKQEKFFDIVTYTGNGTAGRTVSHNLDSVPGMIIVKRTDVTQDWVVFHRSLSANTKSLFLNNTSAELSYSWLNSTDPTSTVVTLGDRAEVNASGGTYVMYLFAHDEQEFGENSDEAIIKCGSYSGNSAGSATTNQSISLGFEPQWMLIKKYDGGIGGWTLFDNMRGVVSGGDDTVLKAESSDADGGGNEFLRFDANGFTLEGANLNYTSGGTPHKYIYVAIRRPNKPASEFAATDLFAIDTLGSTGDGAEPGFRSTFPCDTGIRLDTDAASTELTSRLTQRKWMYTDQTSAEGTANFAMFDYQNGWGASTSTASNYYGYMFRRAKGFFDVVTYTGDGTSTSFSHNLGATPELKIIKIRSDAFGWLVGGSAVTGGTTDYQLYLDTNAAQANTNYWGAVDSASAFSVVASNFLSNVSGQTYIAYLFATVAGISKVGSYTGTGSDLNVDCGFSAGAKFVLIKRTDSTGDWYLYDSSRGIVAGNDPYKLLNSNAAQVTNTDYIDPLSSGFTVTSSAPAGLNASSGTYIFLAIA